MAGRAPLAGIRVADFTWVWAGPFCTLQLAHLGAEVIRVETATRACVTRLLPPFAEFEPGPNRSGYYNQYNQGKKSVALDLKRPEAIEAAKRLCAASDVVVENFAAGVMERMGLGWDVLRALRADLIMIALSGYGATGPDADKVSYGPAQVPLSGVLGDRLPRLPAHARRHLVRRSDRRAPRRGRRAGGPPPPRGQRRGPVHRPLAVGDLDGRAPGGDLRLDDERRRARARRQPGPVRGAARHLPRRRRRPPGRDRGRGRRGVGALRDRDRPSRAGERPALGHRRHAQAQRGRAR